MLPHVATKAAALSTVQLQVPQSLEVSPGAGKTRLETNGRTCRRGWRGGGVGDAVGVAASKAVSSPGLALPN